jgi:hypothetical protein
MPARLLLLWAVAAIWLPSGASMAAPVVATAQRVDAAQRDILAQSLRQAVARLGRKGGFSADPRLRIGMPPALTEAEKLLRRLGAKQETEAFILAMNETAEVLAARAEPMLLSAIREADPDPRPTQPDLTGAPLASGLRQSHAAVLLSQLVPVARGLIQGEPIERVYRRVVKQSTRFGYLRGTAPPLEQYLAQQTLDGLFATMAEAEKSLYPQRASLGVAQKAL